MSPAMGQYLDGPLVPNGPDLEGRAFEAWAEQHVGDLLFRCDDDTHLNVYGFENDGLFWLIQGGDEITIPVEDFTQFVNALVVAS